MTVVIVVIVVVAAVAVVSGVAQYTSQVGAEADGMQPIRKTSNTNSLTASCIKIRCLSILQFLRALLASSIRLATISYLLMLMWQSCAVDMGTASWADGSSRLATIRF